MYTPTTTRVRGHCRRPTSAAPARAGGAGVPGITTRTISASESLPSLNLKTLVFCSNFNGVNQNGEISLVLYYNTLQETI